ncbi:hypothetical protein [Actinoplanes sp. NPDC049681]|uniref:hypothetical protein n=1 Tax=Actinoplanes sp. NPDC049681 TaxID=3363905 RepID=UPI003795684F
MTRTESWGRRRLLGAALAAVLSCAACGADAPAEPSDPPATGTPPAVRFTSSVESRGQALHIRYELVNESGGELIVLNRVPAHSASGAPVTDPGAVYVTGAGPKGRVEIAKRAFAMPVTDKKTWAQPAQISGVTVRPGRAVSEELTVPLPLHRHHPYGDDYGDGPISLPDPVTEAVFCVGVLRATDAPSAGAEAAVVTLPHLSSTTRVQYLSCSPPARW